jgi:MFS family permease
MDRNNALTLKSSPMLSAIRKYKRTILLLLTFAVLARFGYNTMASWDQRLIGDEQRYYGVAENLVEGRGYTFHGEPFTLIPGTSLILALFFLFFGASPALGKIIVSLSSALIAPLTFVFALKLHKKYLPALLAGLWMAIYPYFLHEATMMDSENFFIPLFIIFVYFLLDISGKKFSLPYSFWGGILLGILTLFRPIGYYLAFYLVFWFLLFVEPYLKNWREKLKTVAVFIIGLFLVLSPWIVRNYVVFHKYIPTNTDFLETMLGSNNEVTFTDPRVAGNYLGLYDVIGDDAYNRMPDTERKAYLVNVMKKYWYRLPWLTVQKLKWFWHYSPKHPYHRTLSGDLVGLFYYGIFIPFFIFGFWRHRKEQYYQRILWIILYFCLTTAAMHGTTRYRLPLDPLLITIALYTIWELLPKKIQKKFR